MEFAYDIFPAERAIVTRYAGRFTLAGLQATAEKLWSDPRYSRRYDGLVDLTDGSVGVGMTDFRALLDFVVGHPSTSEGRWAAVAISPLATACGLLYQRVVGRRHELAVFSSRAAACNFVGFQLDDGPLVGGGLRPRRG